MLANALLASALAASASAQAVNQTFVTGLAQFLMQNNLTSFASAIQASANTSGGMNLLMNINGTSKTLLAPTNAAFTGLAANATTNTTLLGERLSYHLLSGSFNGDTIAKSPIHTVARTYLNDSEFVMLEGGKTQAMALSIIDNVTQVINQNTNVTITNTTSYENLLIHVVDAVVDTPGTLTAAFATWNLTAAPAALQAVNFTQPLLDARGITVFVPNDDAFAMVASVLPTLNQSQVSTILANHVINGTTAYSTLLSTSSFTSSGGQSFSLATNGSGSFVTSGSATARVLFADIILQNGVMHIIDTVLINNQSNPSAASSAYMAATSSAAQGGGQQQTGGVGASPTETGPIGGTGTASSSSGSKGSGAVRLTSGQNVGAQAVAIIAACFAGASMLI